MLSSTLISEIETQTGFSLTSASVTTVSGGDISKAYRLANAQPADLFIKVNDSTFFNMFVEEEKGLNALEKACPNSTPKVIAKGKTQTEAFLALEYIAASAKTIGFWQQLGATVATVHSNSNSFFGFQTDNYIGTLPQVNNQSSSWTNFFIQRRLEPQVKLAFNANLLSPSHLKQFNVFYAHVDSLFPKEKPALLHGDLWSGNVYCGETKAYLIDPAVYYGNREMDLAFSLMFGGFNEAFYSSYKSHFPFEPNFNERVDFYNLYHTLVHLNLFGKSYLAPIERVLQKF